MESCKNNGAVARRDCGVQVHIYIGDLEIEELKRIYYLTYHTTGIIKELCQLPPYCDEQRYRPSPTLEFYQRVKLAKSFGDIKTIFENNHNKGYVRHFVNIASYFVRQTVEFRIFNSTTDFRQMMNCIMFAYRFVDYALKHTEEDFKSIKTIDQFVGELKVSRNLPELPPPLIFFSSIREMDVGKTAHKAVDISKPYMSELIKNTGDNVVCVNPQFFSTEIRLSATKNVKVYCNDELNDILYRIVREGLRLTYKGKFERLQTLNGDDAVKQVACVMLFKKLYKFNKDVDFYRKKFDSLLAKLDDSYNRALVPSERIVEFLRSVEYHRGTLNDALKEKGDVFFQYDDYRKNHTAMGWLKKYSDYSGSFEKKKTHYLGVVENIQEGTDLFLISDFPYHNMEKIYGTAKRCLYSTRKAKPDITSHHYTSSNPLQLPMPPDDLQITDYTKLRIVHVQGYQFMQYQSMFVKKVLQHKKPSFPFFVFYDRYLIGAFGMNFTKRRGEYDISLVSDFSTNNKIPRLAKLILLCVKSRYAKQWISRRIQQDIVTCYTRAYTHKPVSMKYRGIFRKVEIDERGSSIVYDCILGTAGSFPDIVEEYQKQLKRMKKNG